MSDEMQKVAEKLCHSIAGQMDANLFESIVSLFNQGVLVHYVRSPRHMVDANNFKMTVEAANGVAFEGRQRIIDLDAKLAAAQKENTRLRELLHECDDVTYRIWVEGCTAGDLKESLADLREKLKRLRGE